MQEGMDAAFVQTISDGVSGNYNPIEAAKQEGRNEVIKEIIAGFTNLFKRGNEKEKVEGLRQVFLFIKEDEAANYLDEWLEGREVNPDTIFKSKDELCLDALPDKLRTPLAQEMWKELFKAGYVDRNCKTVRSRTESAYMANKMAGALGIKQYWKLFAELWESPNLKSAYDKGYAMASLDNFKKNVARIFSWPTDTYKQNSNHSVTFR